MKSKNECYLQPPKRNPAACSSLPSKNLRACMTASLANPSSTSFATLASKSGPCSHIYHVKSLEQINYKILFINQGQQLAKKTRQTRSTVNVMANGDNILT
jgi:hypothetical protein